MDELEAILGNPQEQHLPRVLSWLRKMFKQYYNFQDISSQEFFQKLYTFVRKQLNVYHLDSPQTKERIEIAIRIFLRFLRGPTNNFEPERASSRNPILFQVTLSSFSEISNNQEVISQATDIFNETLQSILTTTDIDSFYAIPKWYHTQKSLNILNLSLNTVQNEIFPVIERIMQNPPNYSTLTFISEIFKGVLVTSPDPNSNVPFFINMMNCYTPILKSDRYSPSIILSLFFPYWLAIYKQISKQQSNTLDLPAQIDNIVNLFDIISGQLYFDLQSREWNLIFLFYVELNVPQLRSKALMMICNAIRRVTDVDRMIRDSNKTQFIKYIYTEYKSSRTRELFIIFKHLTDTIGAMLIQTTKFHAVTHNNQESIFSYITPNQLYTFTSKFSDQGNQLSEYPEIDELLNTKYLNIFFTDREQYLEEVENVLRRWDFFKKKLPLLIKQFFKQFGLTVIEAIAGDDNRSHRSDTNRSYIRLIASVFMQVSIYFSHTQFIINNYVITSKLMKEKLPLSLSNLITNSTSSSDIKQHLDVLFDVVKKIGPAYHNDVVRVMVNELFTACEKGKLTLNLVEFFAYISKSESSPIITKLLQTMLEQIPDKLTNIFSVETNKINLITQWVIFTIRLAYATHQIQRNSPFILSLITYSRLTIFGVTLHLKRLVVMKPIWDMIDVITNVLLKLYPEDSTRPDLNTRIFTRPRTTRITDSLRTSYLLAIYEQFKYVNETKSTLNLNFFAQMLEAAFGTEEDKCIEEAGNFLANIIDESIDDFKDKGNEHIMRVPKLWFKTMNKATPQTMQTILEHTNQFFKIYLSPEKPTFRENNPIKLGLFQFDLNAILKSFLDLTNVSKDEAFQLLILLNVAFESFYAQQPERNINSKEVLINMFILFNSCFAYPDVAAKAKKLGDFLVVQFGQLLLESGDDLFLVALFETISMFKAEMYINLVNIAYLMIKYLNENGLTDAQVRQIIDHVLDLSDIKFRCYTVLTTFSYFIKTFPRVFTMADVRMLFNISSDTFDEYFRDLFTAFIDTFVDLQNESGKDEFISMIYTSVLNMPVQLRHIINKLFIRINRRIKVYNPTDLENCPLPTFYHKFTLGVFSGTITDANDLIIRRTDQFFNQPDDAANIEKAVKAVTLSWALVYCPAIYHVLSRSSQTHAIVFKNIVSTFKSRNPILTELVNSSLQCIKQNDHVSDNSVTNNIDTRIVEPLKTISAQKNDPSMSRRVKLKPDNTPKELAKNLADTIIQFAEKSDDEKLKSSAFFYHVMKTLCLKVFLSRDNTKNTLMKPDPEPLLKSLIRAFVNIYTTSVVPYVQLVKKYIIRLMTTFPNESIDMLLFIEDIPCAFDFAYDMISNDHSNTLYVTLINRINAGSDYLSIKSHIYKLIHTLTNNPRFCSIQTCELLEHAFDKTIKECKPDSPNFMNENYYDSLTEISFAYINCLAETKNMKYILSMVNQLFKLNYFLQSELYHYFKMKLLTKENPEMAKGLTAAVYKIWKKLHPSIVNVILPNAIKVIPMKDPELCEKLWAGVLPIMEDKMYIGPALHTMAGMLDNTVPTRENIEKIIIAAVSCLKDADASNIIYAIKILREFARHELLPPEAFFRVFRHLFYYAKFFDYPYSKPVLALFKQCSNYLEELPPECIETLHLYCNNHINNLTDYVRFSVLLSAAPQLTQYLPFTFVSALSADVMRHHLADKKNDIFRLYFRFSKLNADELQENENYDTLVNIAMEYLKQLKSIEKPEQILPTTITTCKLVIENSNSKLFPHDFLQGVKTPLNTVSFMYVALAMKFIPEEFNSNNRDLIEEAIIYTEKDFSMLDEFYVDFVAGLFKNIDTFLMIKESVLNYFRTLLFGFSHDNLQRLSLYTNELAHCHVDDVSSQALDMIVQNYSKVAEKTPELSSLYFEYVLKTVQSTDYINGNQQELLSFVFKIVKHNNQNPQIFMKIASDLLGHDAVSPTSKEMIIDFVIRKAFSVDSFLYNDFIQACNEYYEKAMITDPHVKIINLLVIAASTSSNLMRINAIDQIRRYLPEDDPAASAVMLKQVLAINLWRDRFLPVIAAVLTPKDGAWFPLFSLAHLLTRVGDELMESVFENVITPENSDDFAELLMHLTSLPKKRKFVKILSALVHVFYRKKIKVPLNTAERALKYSNDPLMASAFFSFPELPSLQKFKPNVLNDAIHSFYSPVWSAEERTASALTMLQQYQTASIVFQDMARPECRVLYAIRSMANRFTVDEPIDKTLSKTFLMLIKTENAVEYTVDALRECGKKSSENNASGTFELYNKTLSYLIRSLRKRKYKSIFEKERAIMIMSILDIFKRRIKAEKPQVLEMSQLISPSMYLGYEGVLHAAASIPPRKHATIQPDTSPCFMLLQPSFVYELPTILGVTEGGLVAAGSEQITAFFQQVGQKISENKMTNDDWYSMMLFSFNVFLSMNSPETFSTAFNACAKVAVAPSNPSRKHTAVAMMLTLIYHAANTGVPEYITAVQDNSGIFAKDNTYIWRTWLQHFITLGKHRWLLDLAHDIFLEMPPRALISAQQLGARDVANILSRKWANDNTPSQLRELEVFESYCSAIFRNNPREIERFNILCAFVEQALKVRNPETVDMEVLFTVGSYKNPLQQAASKLHINDVEKIGDFVGFINEARRFGDLEQFVAHYFDVKVNFDVLDQISRLFKEVNNGNMLPLMKHNEIHSHISFIYLHRNFDYIDDNKLLMKFMSSEGNGTTIIISPTRSPLESTFMESFTNFTYTAHDIMSATYLSRIRNINYPIYEYFQIGENYAMIMVAAEYKSLSQIFVQTTRMKIDEFIESKMSEVDQLPSTALLNYMTSKWDTQSFVKFRTYFMRSHAISAVIGNLLAVDYPTAETCCILFNATSARIVDPYGIGKNPGCPNFRMSKNYSTFYGPNFEGEFALAMAAAAHSFVAEISAMRAILHQILTDNDPSLSSDLNILHERAEEYENRVIAFAPPHPKNTSKESCQNWYQHILNVIEATKTTDLEERYFPWF